VAQAGKFLTPAQWNAYVACLENLFLTTIPQSLIDEREKYLESEHIKKQGQAQEAKPAVSKGELPFNQDACFTKCIIQLLLISAVQETVEKFYEQLQLPVKAPPIKFCIEPSDSLGVS